MKRYTPHKFEEAETSPEAKKLISKLKNLKKIYDNQRQGNRVAPKTVLSMNQLLKQLIQYDLSSKDEDIVERINSSL